MICHVLFSVTELIRSKVKGVRLHVMIDDRAYNYNVLHTLHFHFILRFSSAVLQNESLFAMNTFNRLRSTIPSLIRTPSIKNTPSPNKRYPRLIDTSPFTQTRSSTSSPSSIQLSLGSNTLDIQFQPDEAKCRFPYTWLRDSDPALIHSTTGQKIHLSSQVPLAAHPLEVELVKEGRYVRVVWAPEKEEEEDGVVKKKEKDGWPCETEFSIEMLRRYSKLELEDGFRHAICPIPWTRDVLLRSTDLTLSYPSLFPSSSSSSSALDGLRRGMEQLLRYGILFVEDVPYEETSDERCELGRLARMFGRVRETMYGRFWDVISRGLASRNVAYTDMELGLHMDLAYFEHPPRYQILHMVRKEEGKVVGGESMFSDGLEGAYWLGKMDREAFDVLCEKGVAFHYLNEHHHLYREHRTIQLASSSTIPSSSSSSSSSYGRLLPEVGYINYSPPFQAPLPLSTASDPRFFPALRTFTRILNSRERIFERELKPGMAVVFDNRRVLHGRRGFQSVGKQEGIGRWLKGCYLEGDDLLDRLRVIREGKVPSDDAKGYI